MDILLAITFVYGVIRLFTFTKLFNKTLVGLIESIIPTKPGTIFGGLCIWIDMLFFYFSLIFQVWYWLFK